MTIVDTSADGVAIVDGADKFLAYTIDRSAQLMSSYRQVLPEMLYDFAVSVIFRSDSANGGYLFSVVNPLDTVVQLAVRLSPTVQRRRNVTLIYSDPNAAHTQHAELATFELDAGRQWQQLILSVDHNLVTLYDNCAVVANRSVVRVPREMVFDSASTLYVAQAGKLLGGQFEVSLSETCSVTC